MEHIHPVHEHPLLLIGDQENRFSDKEEHYICSGCYVRILSGSIFICSEQGCKFVLHKSCYESPMEITHFLHTQHPLALHEKSPYESGCAFCDHCKDTIVGFVYNCSICKYDLDITCASMPLEVVEMELQHPFHKHPLKPGEQKHNDKQPICSGCAAPILPGPIFTCSEQGCKFVLHKSCSKLPIEITHFSHTHSLKLLERPPYEYGVNRICVNCNDTIAGFFYHCSICEYDLDVICASLRSSYVVHEEDHEHKFVMIKPTPLKCDICGKESKGKSLLCTTCQAQVHPICSSLPQRVKLFTHNCLLKLTFGHQLENPIDPIKQYSNTCWQKVDTKYGFYYCVYCEYIADIHCATGGHLRDYKLDRYKKIDLQTWHEHGLVLCKDEVTTDDQEVVCRGCVSIISKSAPFYDCKQKCGISLCESCANLYEKIRHPLLHPPHDLVLSYAGAFGCNLCQLTCSGFGYYCKQGGCESIVQIDIKCALRPDVIRIETAHQHPLRIIAEGERYDKKCRGCSSGCDSARYSCPDCDYNLCDRCVGLPTSAKHSWDEHPLVLTYESVPHEYAEYYCDQCEEPRDPNHWFYYCAICDRDVHPKCMGLHNLDPRIIYRLNLHPDHDLILKANPQVYPTCSDCGFACKDFYYQCLECTYYTHVRECEPSG